MLLSLCPCCIAFVKGCIAGAGLRRVCTKETNYSKSPFAFPICTTSCLSKSNYIQLEQNLTLTGCFSIFRAQYNGFNPVTGEDYRPPVHHAHHAIANPNVAADHDPLLQYGNASPDRSTIMTWKHSRPTPAEADVQAHRNAQTGHIQDMRQGRIKTEGLTHTKSTSVGDLI